MKRFLNLALIAAVLLSLGAKPQNVQELKLKEERNKIRENCLKSDRPRPMVEGKLHRSGVLCGKAISLPKPVYPEEAKAKKISSSVTVEIVIDEKGNVEWAKAVSGHDLLKASAVNAACQARYSPTTKSGQAVKIQGDIVYNFVKE
jgi:TonB family protein